MKKVTRQNRIIRNFPQDVERLPRRQFLKGVLGSAAAAACLPATRLDRLGETFNVPEMKSREFSPGTEVGETFWKIVQDQFPIRNGLIMLNAANLCPSPFPVQQMVFDLTSDVDKDPSSHNRKKFNELREKARSALAEYLGVSSGEIAIVRNTSEGNNIVISGLTFKPGDEVIIWDENHPTANIAWDVRAERYGFKVKRVKVPGKISGKEDLIGPFREAMSRRSRVICFSHVSNISGIALPAKEICAIARERGILTHIDGAQTFGSHALDLNDMGCDFFTGSSHKWFIGPKEVGVLYVRDENISMLWPSIVGVGYQSALDKGARKFETLGQRDDSRIAAMGKTVEFHNAVGKDRVEARIRDLAGLLKKRLTQKIQNIEFRTPSEAEWSGGVVVFNIHGVDLSHALDTLYHQFHIGGAVFGGDLAGIRLCPHIYNSPEQVEKAVDAVAGL